MWPRAIQGVPGLDPDAAPFTPDAAPFTRFERFAKMIVSVSKEEAD
jgi:hypothetical protein